MVLPVAILAYLLVLFFMLQERQNSFLLVQKLHMSVRMEG